MAGLRAIWAATELSFQFIPLSFIAFMGITVWFSFRVKESVFLFLAAITGTFLWLEFVIARALGAPGMFFHEGTELFLFAGGMLTLFSILGAFLERQETAHAQACGVALRIWIIRFVVFTMVILGFQEPWEKILDGRLYYPVIIGAFLGLATLASAVWTLHVARKLNSPIERLKAAFPAIGASALLLIMYGVTAKGNESHAVTMQIITNLAAFATAIWLIYRGIQARITHLYFTGVATILVLSLCRYFDLIGDYMGGAALFVVCGGLLFGAARFWQFDNKEPEKPADEIMEVAP